MTQTLIVTGNAAPDVSLIAAAVALHHAELGRRTLLISLSPASALATWLGAAPGHKPTPITPHLDVLSVDASVDLVGLWENLRKQISGPPARINGDELPLLPGSDMFFALLQLREFAPKYARVILDTRSHEGLIRALSLPDSLRWAVRQMIGLDRGPGRNPASVAAALLPTSLLPNDIMRSIQDVRVEAEQVRTLLVGTQTSACYVLHPEDASLADARLAIPALQLFGLQVASLAVGPLIPAFEDARLRALADRQTALVAEAAQLWPTRMLVRFEPAYTAGRAALQSLAQQIAAVDGSHVVPTPTIEQPPRDGGLAIELPGLPKGALKLTISGDELIVRIGSYMRHILLPEGLRGVGAVRATREGDRLMVRRRTN